jgi:hypothetical protein
MDYASLVLNRNMLEMCDHRPSSPGSSNSELFMNCKRPDNLRMFSEKEFIIALLFSPSVRSVQPVYIIYDNWDSSNEVSTMMKSVIT